MIYEIHICFAFISRLSVSRNIIANGLHTSNQLNFHYTPVLYAEPLKKKKKIDPAVTKAREDRKRKKLEKQIRRLEKNARQLKPIEELEIPLGLIDEKELVSIYFLKASIYLNFSDWEPESWLQPRS